jgi:hypothetical protein
LLTQAGANLQAPLQHTPSPWTIQFNVNVQRELPWSTFVEVAYVGTRGYDLSMVGEGGMSLNQLDPQSMTLGSQLNQQVPNPFYGIVNNGVLTQPTVSRAELLRPYPQFTDIVPRYGTGAESRYNAFADHGAQTSEPWTDVRGFLYLRESGGDRDESSGQLRSRRQLGAGVVRHQPPVRDQLPSRTSKCTNA